MDLIPIEEIIQKDKFQELKSSGHLIDIEQLDSYESAIKANSSQQLEAKR